MRVVWHTLAAAAILSAAAPPVFAQNVEVRVKVDSKAVQETMREISAEVREAVRAAFGPEFRQELQGAARDIAGAFESLGRIALDTADWGDWAQSQRFRATQTERETRRFNIGATGQLDLDSISGDITIRPSSGRELVVELVRHARGTTDAAVKAGLTQVRVESEERNGRVTVKTVYPSGRQRDYSVSVDYIVSAPAGTRITTRSISGDVTVQGITGELSIGTTSGDVKVTDAPRLTSATTVSGDLALTNVGAEGLLEGSTMSGDIVATGVKARRLDLGAISGGVTARGVTAGDVKLKSMTDDVIFEGALTPRGRYEFSTHSGDVQLTLDGQVGFSFEAQTFNGSIRSDLAVQARNTGSRASARSLTGTFGDGSAVISATSFSGDVVVLRKR
jgi:DUF4097 and DUF4098 domain-containing protein YvlB